LTDPERWLVAGIVGRPHGLDGSFYVAQPTPELLVDGAAVHVRGDQRRIVRRAGFDAKPIVRLDRSTDRDAALELRGAEILVARETAPQLDEDEWWAKDLEGCTVRDGTREVGIVTRLLTLPSCDVLEVQRTSEGAPLLVPLITDAVREVDIDGQAIDIDLRFLGEA
jgi:16S rRNA processing protein RimM